MKYKIIILGCLFCYISITPLLAQVAGKPISSFIKVENPAVLTNKKIYSGTSHFVSLQRTSHNLKDNAAKQGGVESQGTQKKIMYNAAFRYGQGNSQGGDGIFNLNHWMIELDYTHGAETETLNNLSQEVDNSEYAGLMAIDMLQSKGHIGIDFKYNGEETTGGNTGQNIKYKGTATTFGSGVTYAIGPNINVGTLFEAAQHKQDNRKGYLSFRYGGGASFHLTIDDIIIARLEANYLRSTENYAQASKTLAPNGQALEQDMNANIEISWLNNFFTQASNTLFFQYQMIKQKELLELALAESQTMKFVVGNEFNLLNYHMSLYGNGAYLLEDIPSVRIKGIEFSAGAAIKF